MFEFQSAAGKLNCRDTALTGGGITFRFRSFEVASHGLKWKRKGNAWVATGHDTEFRVSAPRGVLKIEVKNVGRGDVFLEDVTVAFDPSEMADPLCARGHREYIHSMNFASLSGVKKVGLPDQRLKANPESSLVYVVQHIESGKAWLVSALPPHAGDYVTFRALHDAPHLEGGFGLWIRSDQQRLIRPGRKAAVSPIQCRTGSDPLVLLEELGDQWAKARRLPLKDVAVGWNSWDYFAGAVASRDIYKNQRRAKRLFKDKVRYFVIDEGWEPRWGAWTANWKFPEGLKRFCHKIKAGGGIPGVWTAPLLVNTYTDTYRSKPEWFGRDREGRIVQKLLSYGPMAYLDVTHPEAAQFLHDIFARLRREGFEYFKVDFAQCVLECSRFHDMTVGRGAILRRAFDIIRSAIGDDAYLLACGAPFESVSGTVDAVRVTADIHNFWSHVLANAAAVAARWWMHRKLWNVDPDFLIVRSEDTSPDPRLNRAHSPRPFATQDWWLAGREMVLNEVQAYALLVYLSGGDLVLGDDLTQLNAKGVEILRKVLATPSTKAATPVDLFGRHDSLPSLWAKEEEDFYFIGVFNWGEDPKDCEILLHEVTGGSPRRITTFWDGRQIHPTDNAIDLTLPPRSCEGLIVAKDG